MSAKDHLDELVSTNGVSPEAFETLLLETVLEGVFEIAVDNIEASNARVTVLKQFRNTTDELFISKRVIEKYAQCSLPESLLPRARDLLLAYLRKSDHRSPVDQKLRKKLIDEQENRCCLCGCHIELNSSHLDHIVAHKYVGDSLENNYQMLCETCNERKGASPYYLLAMKLCTGKKNMV